MYWRPSRRHLVLVLTCILALAPIGVAMARWTGLPLFAPAAANLRADLGADRNGGAIPGDGLPQYGDLRGGFDIPLPPSTGPRISLPAEVVIPSSFNSLAALDALGSTRGTRTWGTRWAFNGGTSPLIRPGRGSASFATSGNGMTGAGAWGGVSGTAGPERSAASSGRSNAARQTTGARAGSGSGSNSGGGDDAAGAAAGSAGSAETAATAVPEATLAQAGTAGLAPVGSQQLGVSALSPAATPEPLSLMLVGAGLVGMYRARRHFQ